MKITIFSSNQPRHLNLVREIAQFANEVYFVSEVNTVFPGKVSDFYKKSNVTQEYFRNVIQSEKKLFGNINFLPNNVKTLSIKSGDLNILSKDQLGNALSSDLFIVFGASYIKGWLINFLVKNKAINIHMGLAPYYRGSSCNFWAMYDNNPSYVGATIHMINEVLDSGDILFHCVPKLQKSDNHFDFTMRSVLEAHNSLVSAIRDSNIFLTPKIKQDTNLELRYSKKEELTDSTLEEFLNREVDISKVQFKYPDLLL
jgi:methionyl-tRNA formyltransferase